MKGIFDPYLLWPFCKTLIFLLVTGISTRDFTVCCHQKLCHIFFDWQHLWWVQWLYEYQTKIIFDKILIIRNIIESRYKSERLFSSILKDSQTSVRNSMVGSAWKEECLSRNDFNPLHHGMGWPVIEMSALSPNYRVL